MSTHDPTPPYSYAPPESYHKKAVSWNDSEAVHEHGMAAIPVRMAEPSSPPDSHDDSSSSGVVLPSSCRTAGLLVTYLFPLILTISVAASTGYYLVFLAPAVLLIIVLIGFCVWIGNVNMNDFGVDNRGQPRLSRTQVVHVIIARFTLGFWVLGILMSVLLGVESVIIAAFPMDQSTGWFMILFMSYVLLAWQFWAVVYLISVDRSGASVTHGEVKLASLSTMAVAMGCTTAQLWSGFATFAYNVDLFGSITEVDIPRQVSVLIMVAATLVTLTLLPADALGAEYLVLYVRMRACLIPRGEVDSSPPMMRAISYPSLLRGTLILAMMTCLVAILLATGSWAAAVIIYLVLACCMIAAFAVWTARLRATLHTLLLNQPQHYHSQHVQVQVDDMDPR